VGEAELQEGRCRGLDWAACASAYPGQRRSGDAFLVEGTATGSFVAVVDGLGHGDEAADVADAAMAALRETVERPPLEALTACHGALRGSRGAVMALAAIDAEHRVLSWLAVGNVEAAVVRREGRSGLTKRWSVPMRGGVVGARLPQVHASTVALTSGDVLVSATDGIAATCVDAVDPRVRTPELAQRLYAQYARADDDALVLVARCSFG